MTLCFTYTQRPHAVHSVSVGAVCDDVEHPSLACGFNAYDLAWSVLCTNRLAEGLCCYNETTLRQCVCVRQGGSGFMTILCFYPYSLCDARLNLFDDLGFTVDTCDQFSDLQRLYWTLCVVCHLVHGAFHRARRKCVRYGVGDVFLLLQVACLVRVDRCIDVARDLAHGVELALEVLSIQAGHALSTLLLQLLGTHHILRCYAFGNSRICLHAIPVGFFETLSSARSIACGSRLALHGPFQATSLSPSAQPGMCEHLVHLCRIKQVLCMHLA